MRRGAAIGTNRLETLPGKERETADGPCVLDFGAVVFGDYVLDYETRWCHTTWEICRKFVGNVWG